MPALMPSRSLVRVSVRPALRKQQFSRMRYDLSQHHRCRRNTVSPEHSGANSLVDCGATQGQSRSRVRSPDRSRAADLELPYLVFHFIVSEKTASLGWRCREASARRRLFAAVEAEPALD